MERSETDALVFHLGFFALCAAVVLVDTDTISLGIRVLAMVILYNVALPVVARWRGHDHWLSIWAFALPISVLQIIPDWFLADVVGSLVFEVPGLVNVGSVPMYMGLMWTVPLFLVIFVGTRVERSRPGRGLLYAVVTGLVVFASAEALLPMLAIWKPVDVTLIAGVAVYIVPAEGILGAATYVAYRLTRDESPVARVAAALAVMFCYLGAASGFYLAVEIA